MHLPKVRPQHRSIAGAEHAVNRKCIDRILQFLARYHGARRARTAYAINRFKADDAHRYAITIRSYVPSQIDSAINDDGRRDRQTFSDRHSGCVVELEIAFDINITFDRRVAVKIYAQILRIFRPILECCRARWQRISAAAIRQPSPRVCHAAGIPSLVELWHRHGLSCTWANETTRWYNTRTIGLVGRADRTVNLR